MEQRTEMPAGWLTAVVIAAWLPAEFTAFLRKEVALWGKVIREAKIKAE